MKKKLQEPMIELLCNIMELKLKQIMIILKKKSKK